jgi:hypothetical protein
MSMKLNPIAYAIVAAGLVAPAFAAYSGHHVAPKSTCGMPAGKSHVQSIIDGNTYNSGVDSNVCWHNRVRVSGTVEAGYRRAKGQTANGSLGTLKSLDLHQAILGVDAKLNPSWSGKAVLRHGFKNHVLTAGFAALGLYVDLSAPGAADLNAWDVPEAFLTYSNPSRSPLFFKIGKGWVPFGSYKDPYEFAPTITQAASQFNETYAQLGMASAAGWNASVASWVSDVNAGGVDTSDKWTWAANFGMHHDMRGVGVDMNASYLSKYNEYLANDYFHDAIPTGPIPDMGSAWQLGVDTKLAGVDVGANYMKVNMPAAAAGNVSLWGVNAGYGMHAAGYAHHVGVSYEKVKNFLIKSRLGLAYKVGLSKNVDAAVKYVSYKPNTTVAGAGSPSTNAWVVSLTGKF